ncbi:MAG TPA: AMP-binding protein [Thermoanaerobaculia bacterium]|nr:AMP-binding protein [Thermoanaerobaculia bacterium]
MSEAAFYDELETRDPTAREAELFDALRRRLEAALPHAPALARQLAGIDLGSLVDRASLARIPLLRKSELAELQRAAPPFGGFDAAALGMSRVFASPGPVFEPEAASDADFGCFARALFAAGFRRGDLVHNTFSYHFTPAGLMADAGARLLGCAVFPAGTGQSEQQVAVLAHLRPAGYVGTPSFLKILLEKAAEIRADVSSVNKALVSGEALPVSLRAFFEAHGVAVLQCYAIGDVGVLAYESAVREGLIVSEELLIEIVRPGTGDPVPDGEVGEVIVSSAVNPVYSLLRYATGDLSAVLPGPSPCGRTNMRLRGWLGRADQSAKVRGLFVHAKQVGEILRRHPEVVKARLVIARAADLDRMTLRCESDSVDPALAERIAESIRGVCSVRGEVELVPKGSLPNDGKVIEDLRSS